ncbi:MAG: response regulator transcription factor [Deltaproteobacteria bacterium]|nr:response regulator transcription factor [Deltaproteobacteria bacterium]
MTDSTSILIIEDDNAIATGLSMNLKLEGYETALAGDGAAGLEMIRRNHPSLVLLDIGLPKKDGVTLLGELRRSGNRTPVIILSARGTEYDKVAALKIGADDYVTKPFALAELIARIEAVLRRYEAAGQSPAAAGDIEVDSARRHVTCRGAAIKLTHLEFELLDYFVNHGGQVLTREELLEKVWGTSGSLRTVDNFVGQLRSKLEENPDDPSHFITIRGSGYRFDP